MLQLSENMLPGYKGIPHWAFFWFILNRCFKLHILLSSLLCSLLTVTTAHPAVSSVFTLQSPQVKVFSFFNHFFTSKYWLFFNLLTITFIYLFQPYYCWIFSQYFSLCIFQVQTAESAMLLFTPDLKDRIRQSVCPSDLMVFTPPF